MRSMIEPYAANPRYHRKIYRTKSVIIRWSGSELHRQLTLVTALNGRSMPVPFRQSGSVTSIDSKLAKYLSVRSSGLSRDDY